MESGHRYNAKNSLIKLINNFSRKFLQIQLRIINVHFINGYNCTNRKRERSDNVLEGLECGQTKRR